ncbi:purine and other phosphorylase-like protein, family 1 [Rhodanobacter sp. MP7CTX1]|uniref:phosphorylase family protein n=1 Tax=Rhodanobacter sp. MP7CTX1 TaxID=2723084 RepID=UPI0017B79A80|nr:nucleoside phosphorylase [Rhodanobacter sp. MP7CTX1]
MTRLSSAGIVIALALEAKALTANTVDIERVTPLANGAGVWLSGMGPTAARAAAQGLADGGATALATFGVSGALKAGLRNGTLFCPERVVDDNDHDYTLDAAWRTRLLQRLAATRLAVLETGSLLSVPLPLLTTAAKIAAHERYAAVAADMESAAVAEVARDRNLPFIALRAIIDEVDDTVPTALHASVDAWGRPRPFYLIATLSRHPSLLRYLPGLHSRMQQATRSLHSAAEATGSALGWHS